MARRGIALAALLAGLAGCTQPPLQEPLLAVTRGTCDAQPNFAAAVAVRLEDRDGASVNLGEADQCLIMPNGARTTYAVFALPPPAPAYTLEIISRVVPRTIVRPVATLYDVSGQAVRTVAPEEFEADIIGLRAGVGPQKPAHFLVVAADRTRLGQELRLQLGEADRPVRVASAVPVFIPPPIPPTYPDVTRHRAAVVALNGRITVIASPQRMLQTATAAAR